MIIDDGGKLVGRYCGDESGKIVLLAGEYVKLKFHSDAMQQNAGFLILFTALPHGK